MAVYRVTDYGAKGDGSTDDTTAFQTAAAKVNQDGGGTIVIPPGVYVVGRQDFARQMGLNYAYRAQPILRIENCTGEVVVMGEVQGGVLPRLKAAGGLRYGSFDPVSGNPVTRPMPFTDYNYRADAYRGMIELAGNRLVRVRDLELDGNLAGLTRGGQWGDIGWQVHATGIWGSGNRSVEIRNVFTHHHGLDGIQVGYAHLSPGDLDTPHLLEDVNCEHNGRQGLSWVGGIGLTAIRCKFNRTGRGGQISSNPGAGVDVEAEESVCRRGLFVDCQFLDNVGQGFVADSGDTEDVRLVRCRFLGTTNYSIWPNKPGIVFEDCEIYGSVVRTYGSHDSSRATKFLRCHFEDHAYITGRPVYGGIVIEANGENVLYEGCTVIANAGRALWLDDQSNREIIRDTVVIHRATSYAGDFLSLVRGSVLDNVEFREEFPSNATGPWFISESATEIRGPIWVQGPLLRWSHPNGPTGVIGGAATTRNRLPLPRAISYGSAPPVAGQFMAGDVIFNRAPVAGGTAGWICVVSGGPGTWKAFGPISA